MPNITRYDNCETINSNTRGSLTDEFNEEQSGIRKEIINHEKSEIILARIFMKILKRYAKEHLTQYNSR